VPLLCIKGKKKVIFLLDGIENLKSIPTRVWKLWCGPNCKALPFNILVAYTIWQFLVGGTFLELLVCVKNEYNKVKIDTSNIKEQWTYYWFRVVII
jgi:hypothetical protein